MCILASKYYGGRRIRPPAGGPPRGSDMPPACHSLPLGFESTLHKGPYQAKAPSQKDGAFAWWGKVDSPACGRARSAGKRAPGTFSDTPPLRIHASQRPRPNTRPILTDGSCVWWGKVDSNHRRHCQQIYSLSPLATREFPHIQLRRVELVDGLEPPTC